MFRRIGLFTGLLVGIHLAMVDAEPVLHKKTYNNFVMLSTGILFSLTAALFYGNLVGVGRRWKELFQAALDSTLLDVQSYIAAASAVLAVWALTSEDWTAAALSGVMVAVALLTKRYPSQHLQLQYAAIGIVTFYRTVSVNWHFVSIPGTHWATRLITLPLIGAAFYLTAKLAQLREDTEQRILRGTFASLGTAVFAMLVWSEVPELWQPVAFVAFAMALSSLVERDGVEADADNFCVV